MDFDKYWKKSDNVKALKFADLFAMFQFVSGDANRAFGVRGKAKQLVMKRRQEILEEMNLRTYGVDPYSLDKQEVVGEAPEKVLENVDKEE